jgi:rhomboid protease GluP
LALASEVASRLKWEITFISPSGFMATATSPLGGFSENVRVRLVQDGAEFYSENTDQFLDTGRNKKNWEDFKAEFKKSGTEFTPEALSIKFDDLKVKFPPEGEEDGLKEVAEPSRMGFKDFFSFFIPVRGFFVTPVLINLNILIFIVMIISGVHILEPDTEDLVRWGANFKPVTLDGGWWRLITCCFLHIGIIHLLMNLYALVYIGLFLEPLLGSRRFLAAYLLSGVVASVTSLWWNDLVVSAGASGAVFGMYGVFLAMLSTNLVSKSFRKAILTSIVLFIIYNLANGLKGGIDNAAHIGGLISGIIIGYAFYPSLKKPGELRMELTTTLALILVVVASGFLVYRSLPNNIVEYDRKMEEFARLESLALELYQLPANASDEQILKEINTRGIYYWNQCVDLISEADRSDLPEIIHLRNKKLLEYCNLRIKSYELITKAITEQTSFYDTQIEACVNDIETVIEELSTEF